MPLIPSPSTPAGVLLSQYPFAVTFDFVVHGIWRQAKFARPSYGTLLDIGASEERILLQNHATRMNALTTNWMNAMNPHR